MLCIPKLVYKF